MTKPAQDQPLESVLRRIRGEYIEMPGLRLTKSQVKRLWGLDEPMCNTLLDELQSTRFLARTASDAYVLASATRH